ncbi:MAG: cytochrome c nitrite reductase small subunit [Planctomycetota bacterium]
MGVLPSYASFSSTYARRLAVATAIALGALTGLGAFTFGYGDGASYLGNDPASCANCHVMEEYYSSWQNSSHHAVATCNDCHLRHDFVGKWLSKADNGIFHSIAFTSGDFPDRIRIKPRNRKIVQEACLYCHADFAHAAIEPYGDSEPLLCVHCHADVGHAHR